MTGVLDPHDRRLALAAAGSLADFNGAGVLTAADAHVAARFGAILGEQRGEVLLAVALAVRAVRHGSICVDLDTIAEAAWEDFVVEPGDDLAAAGPPDLAWPDPEPWIAAVADSRFVTEHVVRLEGSTLYLDRYWREERQVCDDLVARLRRPAPEVDVEALDAGLHRVFPTDPGYDEQRAAARSAAQQWTTVLTGGPGTGKTTTVAGLLALIAEQDELLGRPRARIALCAPTGKAAARLQQAVGHALAEMPAPDRERLAGLRASTMHRLLGWRPDSSSRFRHHRGNRLRYDLVVVDETSMVSLTMMARLLEALRPDARLVLVGDPDQLSSVEAGAVLGDITRGFEDVPGSPVVSLTTAHRFDDRPGIVRLAAALRGDGEDAADDVLDAIAGGGDQVQLVDPEDEAAMAAFRAEVVDAAYRMKVAADAGDADAAVGELDAHRLLCAHREGRYGVGGWNRDVARLLDERLAAAGVAGIGYAEWFAGRPVLITANDRGQRLNNGDVGITVARDGRLRVVVDGPERREFAPTRLPQVETMFAMTVHKSQGSQARTVSVIMPPEESRLLTRELFYTAVTRAEEVVRIVGTPESIRAAVERRVQRASGLERRLREALNG